MDIVIFYLCSNAFHISFIIPEGLCRTLTCCCNPDKKMWYEKHPPITSYEGVELTSLDADQTVRHHRQRVWQCRIQSCLSCLLCCKGTHSDIYVDVSATLSDMFTYFRGYVPTDILAGIALHAIHVDPKVCKSTSDMLL